MPIVRDLASVANGGICSQVTNVRKGFVGVHAHHSIDEATATIQRLGPTNPAVAIVSDTASSASVAGIAWQLAGAALNRGGSVALADLDLTSPHLHRFLERDCQPGIASVIVGETALGDVLDFRLLPDGRFISVTAGAQPVPKLTRHFATSGPTVVRGLVDYAETVLLVAGPLTSTFARDVVALADVAVLVVDHDRHLGWPKGRPPTLAEDRTPIVAWIAAEEAPPLPAEITAGGPVIDLRERPTPVSSLPDDDARAEEQAGSADRDAWAEDPESLWGALGTNPTGAEPDADDESTSGQPTSQRGFRFWRRSRYMD